MFFLDLIDYLRLVHPAFTVAIVFPLLGIVVSLAWQTRQRRLGVDKEDKSRIPAVVGLDHVKYGKWLAGTVVFTSLMGLLHPTAKYIIRNNLWNDKQLEVIITIAFFVVTALSLGFLYVARQRVWSIVFGILTGLGILLIGFQDKIFRPEVAFGAIFRRDDAWYLSHFYLGITAAVLMVTSLVMIPYIYSDRSQKMRIAHIILNSFALLLFIGQGFTGARDLLEIPLSWQEPFIYRCDFPNKTCDNLIQKQSATIYPSDVERAVRRSHLIGKTGKPTVPVVMGETIEPSIYQLESAQKVVLALDDQVSFWREAL
ncbi:MAG: DUF4079 domain-containing protein [Pseudanabaenaceae cyanobacterium]